MDKIFDDKDSLYNYTILIVTGNYNSKFWQYTHSQYKLELRRDKVKYEVDKNKL